MNRAASSAVITGGTKGLGKAIAAALLESHFDVLLTYGSDSRAAQDCQAELSERFPRRTVAIIGADAASLESVSVLEDAVRETLGTLDVLVLNAGLTERGSLEDITVDGWQRVMDANVTVPVFVVQRLAPFMREGGSVLFTGSLMGIQPHSMSLAYGVTKASVHALVQNLVKFLAPMGIRVNGVAPGFIDTEWQKEKPQYIRDSINSKVALGRFAEPSEIAGAFLFAIENPYLNGEIIKIDGGYSYK